MFRIGVDENGLGSRIGPLVVTGVLARVDERGEVALRRKLPKSMRESLDGSSDWFRTGNFSLGEAWARCSPETRQPLERASSAPVARGHRRPAEAVPEPRPHQCWNVEREPSKPKRSCSLGQKHRAALEKRGIEILEVRTSLVCTERLNHAKSAETNRFISDLHAMEALVLELRKRAGAEIGRCGKVAEASDSTANSSVRRRLAARRTRRRQAKSTYRFPSLGGRFVRDADAKNPWSCSPRSSKYVRELFMGRIARYYDAIEEDGSRPAAITTP